MDLYDREKIIEKVKLACLKGKANTHGTHKGCNKQNIEYGIYSGSFFYYCHECKKFISSLDINGGKIY